MAEGLFRLARWVVLKLGAGAVFEWVLLAGLSAFLVAGLAQIVEHLDIGTLLSLSLLALFCGWMLGRSRVNGTWTALIAILSGLVLIIGGAAQTLSRSYSLLGEAFTYGIVWMNWRRGDALPDPSEVGRAWENILAGLQVVSGRLAGWSASLMHRQPSFDPVASFLVWNFAIWLVVFWAAWAFRRGRGPFVAAIPAVALLATSLSLARGQTWSLVGVLGVIFVLLTWTHYRIKEKTWQAEKIDFVEDIPFNLSIVTFGLVTALLILASAAPALRIERISSSVQHIVNEFRTGGRPGGTPIGGSGGRARPTPAKSLSESLGLEVRKPPAPVDFLMKLQAGGLPRQHLLGAGPELSKKEVFQIKIKPASSASEAFPVGSRYYWRALTYDVYTGRGWMSSPVQEIRYQANHPALSSGYAAESLVDQQVQIVDQAIGLNGLYVSAGEPLAIDQDYVVAWRYRPQAGQPGGDVFGTSAAALEGQELSRTYEAQSLVSLAGSAQLRAAGTEYPAWIRERFLSLPGDLPSRVYQLARDLTAPEPTPYDQAVAIQTYLRKFPYTLDIGAPPADRDVVDYFLFDLKKGYCDYYASAMVVLARAVGIPSRLAMGYASGEYDPQSQQYRVTEADGHSWPELYFPNYGWIGFEPTANQPVIERLSEAATIASPQIPNPPELPGFVLMVNWRLVGGLLFSATLLALLGWCLWVMSEPWRLKLLSPHTCLDRIYLNLIRFGERLPAWEEASHTPREVAEAITQQLVYQSAGRLEQRYPAALPADLVLITDLYNRELYSSNPAGRLEQIRAVDAWERLRFQFWWARIARPLNSISSRKIPFFWQKKGI